MALVTSVLPPSAVGTMSEPRGEGGPGDVAHGIVDVGRQPCRSTQGRAAPVPWPGAVTPREICTVAEISG
jgi:hypothetical protein